jgi:hypothetical protein
MVLAASMKVGDSVQLTLIAPASDAPLGSREWTLMFSGTK